MNKVAKPEITTESLLQSLCYQRLDSLLGLVRGGSSGSPINLRTAAIDEIEQFMEMLTCALEDKAAGRSFEELFPMDYVLAFREETIDSPEAALPGLWPVRLSDEETAGLHYWDSEPTKWAVVHFVEDDRGELPLHARAAQELHLRYRLLPEAYSEFCHMVDAEMAAELSLTEQEQDKSYLRSLQVLQEEMRSITQKDFLSVHFQDEQTA